MIRSTRIVENPEPRTWYEFVCAHSGHLLQSAAWGELKAQFGWSVLRVALEEQGTLVAGAQILLRHLPLGLALAYIPRGPVCDADHREPFQNALDTFCRAARNKGAFALKIEPDWVEAESTGSGPLQTLRQAGFVSSATIQPRTTVHVDLTRDLDTILAQMKSKWRYNIRLAERKGVTVRTGTAADVPIFYQLEQVTSERDHFGIHSLEYYSAAFELLSTSDHLRLLIAEYAGEPLAAIYVTAFGPEAIYLYGASSNAHRERMPNHALHWAAIQWAKSRGCTRYDLWGIAEPAGANSIPNALPEGLYQFKQGFGGKVVQYAGAYDAVFSRLRYAVFTQGLKWRRGGLG